MYTLDEQGNKLKVERYKKASNDVKVVRAADSDKDDKFLSNSMLTILLVLLMYYMYLLIR